MMVAAPKKTTHMQQRTFLLLQLLRNLVHNDSKTPNLSCLCHDALNYKTQQKLSKKPNATHSVTHLKVNFTIGQKSQIIWKKKFGQLVVTNVHEFSLFITILVFPLVLK